MWMLTNATLAILIENISGLQTNEQQAETELRARQDTYFKFILWATFGLSAVRFLGVSPYVSFCKNEEFGANVVVV
jgi:chitin synthase